jgi:hypothetical protein
MISSDRINALPADKEVSFFFPAIMDEQMKEVEDQFPISAELSLPNACSIIPNLNITTTEILVSCYRSYVRCFLSLSRVREEEALAPLSAPVFRPSGTYSSNFILFCIPTLRLPDRLVAMPSSPIVFF